MSTQDEDEVGEDFGEPVEMKKPIRRYVEDQLHLTVKGMSTLYDESGDSSFIQIVADGRVRGDNTNAIVSFEVSPYAAQGYYIGQRLIVTIQGEPR